VLVLDGEMKRIEIQEALGLKHRENFVSNYLMPSLESAYIEMTIPETPTHQEQRYRLSAKGIELKKKLLKSQKKK
jgi:ATP-dependent DNA helicase RecG